MLKLLVVEDHVLVREGLAQTLRHLEDGVQIFEATDSEYSLALLERESSFDLMVLDLGLPGRDGFFALEKFGGFTRKCRSSFFRPTMTSIR